MEFHYIEVNKKPFHEECFKKDGDPNVCGNAELPLSYKLHLRRAECYGSYAANNECL